MRTPHLREIILRNPQVVASFRSWFVIAVVATTSLSTCAGVSQTLVTVYSPLLSISIPIPAGWSTEIGSQAGFKMQIFTGPSVDVPERPGIRVQVMTGPIPSGRTVEEIAERYVEGQEVSLARGYSLHGFAGKSWYFSSQDGAEQSRLMLTPIEGILYGIYAHGEAGTVASYSSVLDAMWNQFSVEREPFFEVYSRPELSLQFRHPRSWHRTKSLGDPGKSFYVGFRSPALARGIHATLEVSVNTLSPGTTLEAFYTERTDTLGDNYRLVRHEQVAGGKGISNLYGTETQLASYLERTFYFVRDDKSFVYKFIVQNVVYTQIEPWIEEIAKSFPPGLEMGEAR